jgi:pteridine reductase
MPDPALAPKTALVTGGGTRVGAAIAQRLGALGMRVAIHYRTSLKGAERTCSAIEASGGSARPFHADLQDRTAARQLVDDAVAWLGSLDLLVLSAANFERVPFAELDDAAWDRSLSLNAASQFSLAHQAAPALIRASGNIVFITCASTGTPLRNYLPYVVSKAAELQLARTLALELAPHVRVNAVAPGTVLPPDDMPKTLSDKLRRSLPLQRLGNEQDVADAVVYLATASFVTGQQIFVDGGRNVASIERFE